MTARRDAVPPSDAGPPAGGVLRGLRVLDLTRNIAGPYCAMILGDLGAEVIKVERPGGGDDTREWRPPAWNGISTTFLAFNRNKKSVAVDLDRDEGRDVILKMARRSDVLLESFRRGSLARRGLGYARVSAENPRIVYCTITAFGSVGPHKDRPGYDPVLQAYSGIMSLTGEPGGRPLRTGPSIVDNGTGMWAALGVVCALLARERTGRGAHVETSLLDTGVTWIGYHLLGYLATGRVPKPVGTTATMIAPYEGFATRDGHLQLAAGNNRIWLRLCEVLGLPGLPADPRFHTNADRVAHRDELHEILEQRFRTESAAHWEEVLLAQGVPCSRVRTLADVAADPQVAALGLLTPVAHPDIPNFAMVDLPVAIDGRRAAAQVAPPAVGQHTDEVLGELGYSPAEIAALRETGAIG
ncbi:MAG TPA: CaiB/BaiF CoA-transferase family protein [bacterium]|nr:CaiB/BaiF CoA-transferase family protein [bacterium]